MPLAKAIGDYESVADWAKGLREQWGGDPLAEEPEKLESLAGFCEFAGQDPDELIAFCFLRRRETGSSEHASEHAAQHEPEEHRAEASGCSGPAETMVAHAKCSPAAARLQRQLLTRT